MSYFRIVFFIRISKTKKKKGKNRRIEGFVSNFFIRANRNSKSGHFHSAVFYWAGG